jgi:hypothetical protein
MTSVSHVIDMAKSASFYRIKTATPHAVDRTLSTEGRNNGKESRGPFIPVSALRDILWYKESIAPSLRSEKR